MTGREATLLEQVQAVLDDALDWTEPDPEGDCEAFIKPDTAARIVALAIPMPEGREALEIELLREVLVFADGHAKMMTGRVLADLYAEDSEKQGVLERAGCHPRTSPPARETT